MMSDHGNFSSYEGHKDRQTGKIRGTFPRVHRALDGWMLARAPATLGQGLLLHHGPRYFNFLYCYTISTRGLGRMMAVFVEVFGAFGLTISESKTETMCMPIPRAPATNIVFNATGQQYRQTTSFTYLGGTVTEMPNLSD